MLLTGITSILSVKIFLLIPLGVFLGLMFGSIPGLTATMAIALCLPITYGMDPLEGMILLVSLYIGGVTGGLIPAILLKIPGTPSSVATTFDGYSMAQNGEPSKALGLGIISSFIGGLISILTLMLIAPPLADLAIKFGPIEYFAVSLFALTMIASLAGDSLLKGLLAALLGVALAMVGSAPIDSFARFTFEIKALNDGFDLLPVLIGLFGLSEVFITYEKKLTGLETSYNQSYQGLGSSVKEFFYQKWNLLRSTLIGIGIGILPGIGGSTSNLIAYSTAKNRSKYPDKFGTGISDGIIAAETSNNASVGGALVPLTVLGIPGDTATALLLGGLIMHGLTPGPLLFQESGTFVYGIFSGLFVANIFVLIILLFGLKVFVKLLSIPKTYLLPIILLLCVIGSYGVNNRFFDVWTLLAFGLLGYLLVKFKYPLAPVILGFILGPIVEVNFRRGLMQTNENILPFFTSPIALAFFVLALISITIPIFNEIKKRKDVYND